MTRNRNNSAKKKPQSMPTLPPLRRPSPIEAANIVINFAKFAPNKAGLQIHEYFPSESLARGPAYLIQALEVLNESVDERGDKFYPYFKKVLKKQINEEFALGLLSIAKWQPYFPVWMMDSRYQTKIDSLPLLPAGNINTPFSLDRSMGGGNNLTTCGFTAITSLIDPKTPAPLWQSFNYSLIQLIAATLFTEPSLAEYFGKKGGFRTLASLVRGETNPPPVDILQKIFLEFVGRYMGDDDHYHDTSIYIIQRMEEEVHVTDMFIEFAIANGNGKDPGSIVDFSTDLICELAARSESGGSTTANKIMKKLERCDKTDRSQIVLTGMIEQMIRNALVSPNIKECICRKKNMKTIIKLMMKTLTREGILGLPPAQASEEEGDEAKDDDNDDNTNMKLVDGYPIGLWFAQGYLGIFTNAIGGSAEAQLQFLQKYGNQVGPRLIEAISWLSEKPIDTLYGTVNGIICSIFYKIGTRNKEGGELIVEIEGITPLLRLSKRTMDFTMCLSTSTRADNIMKMKQNYLYPLMGAAAVGHGISSSLFTTPTLEQEQRMMCIFQSCVNLISESSKAKPFLQFEHVTSIVNVINAFSILYNKDTPKSISNLRRTLKYIKVRSTNGDSLPYLTIIGELTTRDGTFCYHQNAHMTQTIDYLIENHQKLLLKFLGDHEEFKEQLTEEEEETLFWAECKVKGGSVIDRFRRMFQEEENPMPRREVEEEKICNAMHCCNYEKLSICTGCKSVWYCGVSCQRADWKYHKATCKKLAKKLKK